MWFVLNLKGYKNVKIVTFKNALFPCKFIVTKLFIQKKSYNRETHSAVFCAIL